MQKKQAQSAIYDDLIVSDVMLAEDVLLDSDKKDEDDKEDEEHHEEHFEDFAIIVEPEQQAEALVFMLPNVPGAPDAGDIIFDEDNAQDIAVEEEKEVEVAVDPWDWQAGGLENYLHWLDGMMKNPPSHSGYDSTGIEKAIAYYSFLEKTIPKAMRADIRNVVDSRIAEQAREQIHSALDRLQERLSLVTQQKYTKKKSWAHTTGMVKEARSPGISAITITVPLIISRCARVCINGTISGGHDLEELFKGQVEEYDLDKIQQAELCQLLEDMGYPMRQDRGFAVGTHVDQTRSDNRDWAANYQA